MSAKQGTKLLLVVVLARLGLGLVYSATVPPWEAHDETGHYAYVHYVASHSALPPAGGVLTPWFDEAHQPPLYYLIAGLIGRFLAPSEPPSYRVNPFFMRGDLEGGVNAVVHDPREEGLPYRGHLALLYLARALSNVLSAGAVLVVYLIASTALPGHPFIAVGSAVIAAYTPTYLFVGGAVNNDAMITLTACLLLLAGLKVAQGGGHRWAAAMGLSLGLALLSKNSALAYIPFVAIAVGTAMVTGHASPGQGVRSMAVAYLTAGAVALWWYIRNLVVYGRPLIDREPSNPIISTFSPFVESLGKASPTHFVAALADNTFRSYWALFGWGNIAPPHIFYTVTLAVTLLAGAGLLRALWRHRFLAADRAGVSLLVVFWLLTAALPLYRAIYFNSPTLLAGRYLLPTIAPVSILLAVGLYYASPRRLSPGLLGLAAAGLLVAAATFPWTVIAPAYRPPPLLTEKQVQESAEAVFLNFGHQLALIGYQIGQTSVQAGEYASVTLYWKALGRMDEDYTIGVHLVDHQSRSLGQLDRYPGRGNYATSLWSPGAIFAETYRVPISPTADTPLLGRFRLVVHRYVPDPPNSTNFRSVASLPAYNDRGERVNPVFGEVKIKGRTAVDPGLERRSYLLGDSIELIGFRLSPPTPHRGEELRLRLLWRAHSTIIDRYVVFVHLVDAGGKLVAQSDSEPRSGAYPTYLWEAGEVVPDEYELALDPTLLPGEYSVHVGLYRRDNLNRLSAVSSDGQRLQDDRIPLASVLVE